MGISSLNDANSWGPDDQVCDQLLNEIDTPMQRSGGHFIDCRRGFQSQEEILVVKIVAHLIVALSSEMWYDLEEKRWIP